MSLDPRTPVLIGVGQLNQRVDQGEPALEPADLIAEAARRAEVDSGASGVVQALESVRVVALLSWRYRDPGAVVAARLGASPADTAVSPMGGNSPQTLLNQTCLDIQAGRLDLALLGGAEAWRTRSKARSADAKLDWTVQDDEVPAARVIGHDLPMNHPSELARGVVMPVQFYPLFEHALRHEAGRSADEHQRFISELWARFSAVAASNPNAWIQREYTADEIATSGPDNRMVGFPYTKLLNSNNAVEQGAALILASVEKAEALGVPRDRWVFPWSGTDAHDHVFVSERDNLYSSPAIRIAGQRAFELAGVGVDDIAHVDLYSCFPSAVQIGANELGFSLDRQLTVTGGLSFAGGPWNNYVMHSIAAMADRLRADPGALGFCSANGGYVTKHAMGLYSTEPPQGGFRHADVQAEVDALPKRAIAEDASGAVTIESHTVMFSRENEPETAVFALLTADGQRTWGTSTDPDVMKVLLIDDLVGTAAQLSPEGTLFRLA